MPKPTDSDLAHIVEPLRHLAIPIDDLVLDPENAREHPAQNLAAIGASLETFQQRKNIVVRRSTMTVEAGNGLLTQVRAAGKRYVAAVMLDDDEDTATAYALADNRTAELARWNNRLPGQLKQLEAAGWEPKSLGWTPQQLRAAGGEQQATTEDEVPERPDKPNTKGGDVWVLGDHMLMCGDSCKRDDVARLWGDDRADAVFTDPPYGVMFGQAGYGKKNVIRGDNSQATIPVSFDLACNVATNEHARFYVCGGWSNTAMMNAVFDLHLRMMPRMIIWAKEGFLLRRNGYHSQFEVVFFGWKGQGGSPEYWYGDRKQSDLWEIERRKDTDHPTEKPIEVPARGIRNSCPEGGLVYEPFCGSGATLVAAEQLGRRCRAIELEPGWCDVVVERWQNLTGGKAKRKR